jgi:fructose-1,6-bisphosphatase II
VAIAPRGTLFNPGPAFYMDKLVVGPEAAGKVDIDDPVATTLATVAKSKGLDVDEVTVVILDRQRNQHYIQAVREAGARVRLITDGDVAPALMTALPGTGIDVVLGSGGTPEGVITACALQGLGGEIQGRLLPQSEAERARVLAAGLDIDRKLTLNDLASGDDHFFAATGITQGDFLKGVRYTGNGAITHSLVTRSRSGTWRTIEANHRWSKLMKISEVEYS